MPPYGMRIWPNGDLVEGAAAVKRARSRPRPVAAASSKRRSVKCAAAPRGPCKLSSSPLVEVPPLVRAKLDERRGPAGVGEETRGVDPAGPGGPVASGGLSTQRVSSSRRAGARGRSGGDRAASPPRRRHRRASSPRVGSVHSRGEEGPGTGQLVLVSPGVSSGPGAPGPSSGPDPQAASQEECRNSPARPNSASRPCLSASGPGSGPRKGSPRSTGQSPEPDILPRLQVCCFGSWQVAEPVCVG